MGKPGRADRTVTASRDIAAPAQRIFDLLADPRRHQELDGSGQVRGDAHGPDRLAEGARFSMAMHQGKIPYRSSSRVVEFDENRVIAWQTIGKVKGRTVIGVQIWRYELTPLADGTTRVTHSYDWGAARLAPLIRLLGYPRRTAASMPRSLERLARAVAT